MKKNVMMRVASVLLIAVMMTTCAISGTFAKYVTSNEGSDSARVAKWGVEIVANGSTFGYFYKNEANGNTISSSYEAATDSVASSNGEKLVAPGTGDSVVAMSITGTPEVDVEVAYDAQLILDGWVVDGYDYCPIIFTVNGETYGLNGLGVTVDHGSDNIAALIADVEKAIEDYTAEYEANQNLNDASTVKTPEISWEWPFYVSDANDVKDTKLGDAAADGNAATIKLVIKTTVTQID